MSYSVAAKKTLWARVRANKLSVCFAIVLAILFGATVCCSWQAAVQNTWFKYESEI